MEIRSEIKDDRKFRSLASTHENLSGVSSLTLPPKLQPGNSEEPFLALTLNCLHFHVAKSFTTHISFHVIAQEFQPQSSCRTSPYLVWAKLRCHDNCKIEEDSAKSETKHPKFLLKQNSSVDKTSLDSLEFQRLKREWEQKFVFNYRKQSTHRHNKFVVIALIVDISSCARLCRASWKCSSLKSV
jgi:hypothetical protein